MIRTTFTWLTLLACLVFASPLLQNAISEEGTSKDSQTIGELTTEGNSSSEVRQVSAKASATDEDEPTEAKKPATKSKTGSTPRLLDDADPEEPSPTEEPMELKPTVDVGDESKEDVQDSGSDSYSEDAKADPKTATPRDMSETDPMRITDEPKPVEAPSKRPTAKQPPAAKPIPLTPELVELRDRLRLCLAQYYVAYESADDHSPWGIMHAFIAYGVETQVLVNDRRYNACSYLCWNGSCRGMQMMYLDQGKLGMRIGPGVQGHPGQFLAMLAQSKVKRDYPIHVGDKSFTVGDLIECEMATCRPKTELTFKLIGLSHYLDIDETWKSNDGQDWSIPRLIQEEISQPIIGAACGGTHRLTGLTYAVKKRERSGQPMDGQYKRAKQYLDAYRDYTFSIQNPNGSFSTDWFKGAGDWGDGPRRLETTGHILEWMVVSLPQEQLTDPRVVAAVNYLTTLMLNNTKFEWAIGPKGHALHALALYDERVFGSAPGNRVASYMNELQKARAYRR